MIHFWEGFPYADRLAGPRWFRRFVVEPVPGHITEVRGRYHGSFRKGFVVVTFKFEPPFERGPWMIWWHEMEVSTLIRGFLRIVCKAPNSYRKQYYKAIDPAIGSSTFILLDEEAGRGVLYESSWFPILEALKTPEE